MEAKNSNKNKQIAIVMVPFPLQGHLNQLLQLSHLISSYGLPVHYVGSSTHNRQAKLRLAIRGSGSPTNIHFHNLELPPYESPNPNPSNHFPTHFHPLFNACLNLRQPVYKVVQQLSSNHSRVVVIHDNLMAYVVQDCKLISSVETYVFFSVSAFCMIAWETAQQNKSGLLPESNPSMEDGCFSQEALEFILKQEQFLGSESGRLYNTSKVIENKFVELLGPCNPVPSRCRMAELLFESYGVPSVAFGVDAAFSYTYNQRLGICDKEGLAVSCGFNTSHVIPFVAGEPVFEACCRTNVGGYHVTDYMKQLLSLKYPQHMAKLTWEKVEDLKMEHCYIAQDYASEVKLFKNGTKEAEEKTKCWQLPFTPLPVEEQPSVEELARKAAIKEKQGQRLREMAEAKRASRIQELEHQLRGLDFLLRQLEKVVESDVPAFLSDTGYISKQEIEASIAKINQSLRKAKREQVELEEKADAATAEKFPLVDVPDNMLTPEQLKEKKKQVFLKTTAEGRQRARQKRAEEELQREKQNQLEEEKRLQNPELYLEQLRTKYKELLEKIEQKKRLKTNGNTSNGNNTSGGVGRGERMNPAKKERMRLLTTAAFDRGKGEDTFGARDEDWELYKLMSKDNDDEEEGPDEDETELTRISSKLQELDPAFNPKSEYASYQTTDAPRPRPLTKEDFQIQIGVERFRCPEILFNPNIVGIDQSGLDEMIGVSLRRFSPKGQGLEEKLTSSILLTGGSCQYPGMSERLEAGVRMIRPCGTPIRVVKAANPVYDAWRGASLYASSLDFPQQIVSKLEYEEMGEDRFRRYKFRYTL